MCTLYNMYVFLSVYKEHSGVIMCTLYDSTSVCVCVSVCLCIVALSSDDLLPILIYLVVKTEIPSWYISHNCH